MLLLLWRILAAVIVALLVLGRVLVLWWVALLRSAAVGSLVVALLLLGVRRLALRWIGGLIWVVVALLLWRIALGRSAVGGLLVWRGVAGTAGCTTVVVVACHVVRLRGYEVDMNDLSCVTQGNFEVECAFDDDRDDDEGRSMFL